MAMIAVRDGDDALDIVQDAMLSFVKVYRQRPEEKWPPLFHKVLQSRIIDSVRRNAIRNRFRVWFGFKGAYGGDDDRDPIQEFPDTGSADQSVLLENRNFSGALDNALGKLPLRQQQAFMLRFREELNVAQTALAMGCSEGSVKTHTSRAVHTLRELLEEFEP
jgi:RNA polymerase sigma-70 factor, ECF subfamily